MNPMNPMNPTYSKGVVQMNWTTPFVLLTFIEYLKLDRDKSTFKSHRDFDSEIEMTFKHF